MMFVLASTHRKEVARVSGIALAWKAHYDKLLGQWNDLVERVNAKGGMAALSAPRPAPFESDDIRKLLMLCHPDKHDGKQIAVQMTQKLLALRSSLD